MTRTWPTLVALGALLLTGCAADPTDAAGRADREHHRPDVAQRSGPDGVRPAKHRDRSEQARERRIVAPRTTPPTSPPADPFFGRADADGHLVGAASFGTRWSVSRTADEDGRLATACQAASLADIGAQVARIRDYAAPRGAAVQAVAEFVDRASARRADAVLLAWRERCADRLRERDAALGTARHGVWVSLVEVSGVRRPGRRVTAALDDVRATFG